MPVSLPSILDELASKDMALGLFLIGAGLLFMLMGLRVSRPLIAISFGVIGFVLGGLLSPSEDLQLAIALTSALAFGAISMKWMKASAALLTGCWTGTMMLAILSEAVLRNEIAWSGAALTCFLTIALTYVLFDETVAFTTSLEGSLLLIAGLVIFFAQSGMIWGHIRSMMIASSLFAPFMVVSGTVIGFYCQLTGLRHKQSGMSI